LPHCRAVGRLWREVPDQYWRQLVALTTRVIGTDSLVVPSEAHNEAVKVPTTAPAGSTTAT
jgi:hypothetical protein